MLEDDGRMPYSEIALKLTADGACLVKRIGYVVNVDPSMVRLKHAPVSNP